MLLVLKGQKVVSCEGSESGPSGPSFKVGVFCYFGGHSDAAL